jgi:hypothetical protein
MKSLCVPKEYHLSEENNLVAQRSCTHYLGGMQSLKDGLPLKMWKKMWMHQGRAYQGTWFV